VVAAVDVERFAGDEARRVVRQEGGGDADIVDADEPAGGRLSPRLVEQENRSLSVESGRDLEIEVMKEVAAKQW
jgi:hypothetical protein